MYDDCEPVYALISDLFHTPVAMLSPETRIVEDLRIDGEDAEILFNEIEKRFGTDLRNLRRSWNTFFRSEHEVRLFQSNKLGIVILVILIAIALCLALSRNYSEGIVFGSVLFKVTRRSLRISDIAHAIKIGFWPRYPLLAA